MKRDGSCMTKMSSTSTSFLNAGNTPVVSIMLQSRNYPGLANIHCFGHHFREIQLLRLRIEIEHDWKHHIHLKLLEEPCKAVNKAVYSLCCFLSRGNRLKTLEYSMNIRPVHAPCSVHGCLMMRMLWPLTKPNVANVVENRGRRMTDGVLRLIDSAQDPNQNVGADTIGRARSSGLSKSRSYALTRSCGN